MFNRKIKINPEKKITPFFGQKQKIPPIEESNDKYSKFISKSKKLVEIFNKNKIL